MEWWQVAMILLAILVLGIFIGILLYYLYLRFILKRDVSLLNTLTLLFAPKKLRTHPVVEEQQIVVEEQQNLTAPDLLAEINHNHNIASQPLGERLLPLETRVWEARQHEVDKLPAKLRYELQQIYIDIGLANNIVWLSTEFGRRSPDSEKTYMMLCNVIAERLDRVKETGQAVQDGVKVETGEVKERVEREAENVKERARMEDNEAGERARREVEDTKEIAQREAADSKEKGKQEAKKTMEMAEKETEEARERARREAEEAKERIRKEIEEAEGRAEKQAQEVKKAKEAVVKKQAEQAVIDKRTKEAQEAKERAQSELEEVTTQTVPVGSGELADSRLYNGMVELAIASPAHYHQITEFQEYLHKIQDLRLVLVSGTVKKATKIIVSAGKPLPLLDILSRIPNVEQVTSKRKTIQITLRAE